MRERDHASPPAVVPFAGPAVGATGMNVLAPPRRRGWLRPARVLASAVALLVSPPAARPAPPAAAQYVCPPCGSPCDARVFDHPGPCPMCGMQLVPRSPSEATLPPLPRTGFDVSSVRAFRAVAGLLLRDREPSEAQWRALLDSPGYRLAAKRLARPIRDDLDLALRPSRRAEFERASRGEDDRALTLRHLALAARRRDALVAFADSLARTNVIAEGVATAARLLPAGATRSGPPPLVCVAIFKDDGFSLPEGVVMDLLYMRSTRLSAFFGHEFHHAYVRRLARPLPAAHDTAADDALRQALTDLRDEGIADQIDKPHPFVAPTARLASYAARYNLEYARTPETLRRFDALLAPVADSSASLADRGGRAGALFWSNGHPNGAYVAREVADTFGADSLRAAALDPAALLRMYAEAEVRHGRPDPLSAKTWRVIRRLEAKYWAR